MSDAIAKVKAQSAKQKRQRDNWKARALQAGQFLELATRHIIENTPTVLWPKSIWLWKGHADGINEANQASAK